MISILNVGAQIRWDVVVVDEAHDLKEDWWLSVHELLKDKKKSYLWAFIDPLQDIFSRKSLEQFSLRPAPLFFNCRNTKEIAKFSYGWVDDKPHMHPESPQGEEVEDIYYKDNLIDTFDLFASENVDEVNKFTKLIRSINFLIWGDV